MSLARGAVPVTADLWSMVLDQQWVDPQAFAGAIERQVVRQDLDYRTRLLIRDGIEALAQVWGRSRVEQWLDAAPVGDRLRSIAREALGEPGFPFLAKQLMEPTRPETIRQFLRELGSSIDQPARIVIGGSGALILRDQLARQTQDLDVVDELPASVRVHHDLLHRLVDRYRLQLTHFQSHYLPAGWESRTEFFGRFGVLEVALVDTYDIAVGKLTSAREKDRDDLRALVPKLDKQTLQQRLREAGGALLQEPKLRHSASQNWYILFGEPLPA